MNNNKNPLKSVGIAIGVYELPSFGNVSHTRHVHKLLNSPVNVCVFFYLKILTVWSDHNSWLWISNEIIVSNFEINFHIATHEYELNEEKDLEQNKKKHSIEYVLSRWIVKWFRRWNRWQNARRRIFWSQVPDERFYLIFFSFSNKLVFTNAHRIGRDESKMHIQKIAQGNKLLVNDTANSSICKKQVYSNWFLRSVFIFFLHKKEIATKCFSFFQFQFN